MTVDPQIKIDKEYSDAIIAATKVHEQDVAEANVRYAKALAASDDPEQHISLTEAFDTEIAPARDAYHKAVGEAEAKRESALRKIKPTEGGML